MSIERWLMAAAPKAVIPEAVDLDGTNDFFSRASDLTGNTDSKTLTLSIWCYLKDNGATQRLYVADTGAADRFRAFVGNGGQIIIQ
jgi:hypothetical protein